MLLSMKLSFKLEENQLLLLLLLLIKFIPLLLVQQLLLISYSHGMLTQKLMVDGILLLLIKDLFL